jgi:capsular polysaccharide biosynthesis protein
MAISFHLGRAKIHMSGFDDDLLPLQIALRSLEICLDRTPVIESRTDSIHLPVVRAKDGWLFDGGLFMSDGTRDPAARLVRLGISLLTESRIDPSQDLKVIEAPVMYLGWHFNHFGHMVIEGMARSFAAQNAPKGTLWLISTPDAWPPTLTQNLELLTQIGIDPADVLDPGKAYRIKQLLVPHPGYLPQMSVTGAFLGPFHRAAENVMGPADLPRIDSAPVFLSRSALAGNAWHNEDETRLETLLAEFGMQVVHPEAMTLVEQIRLFNRHSTFVGLIGSAFHGKLFSLRPTTTLVMSADFPNLNYLLIDSVTGGAGNYGRMLTRDNSAGLTAEQRWRPQRWDNAMRLKWIEFAAWLHDLGLLTATQADRLGACADTASHSR